MFRPLRIVFMGTPEFAVTTLARICESSHQVVAVVTVADKPAGRGQEIQMSPVKKFALEKGLPILQPEKLKSPDFIESLKTYQADIFVVVAFRMLPEIVWSMPPLGSINLHGSLLPAYRGAAPINRAIMNGEKETGVTVFFLQHEIDTGRIIRRQTIPIGENDTAGDLHDRMMHIGAHLLVEALDEIAEGKYTGTDQDTLIASGASLSHAPKIFRDDCRIDWTMTCDQVHNHIRGLSPYPAAWTMLGDKTLKIFMGEKLHGEKLKEAWTTDGKTYLRFACADGCYDVKTLQYEGKKRMSVEEFLRGWRPN